jgi:hypothetical protein
MTVRSEMNREEMPTKGNDFEPKCRNKKRVSNILRIYLTKNVQMNFAIINLSCS